jgi:hypothetical protein
MTFLIYIGLHNPFSFKRRTREMSYSRDEIVAMTTEYLQVRDVVKNVDMDVLLFTGSSSSFSSTSN